MRANMIKISKWIGYTLVDNFSSNCNNNLWSKKMGTRKVTRYTDEFRLQIVKLHENGKPVCDIVTEYSISSSTII